MPLTEDQQLALLSTELQGALADGAPSASEVTAFEAYLAQVWEWYEDAGLVHPRLRYLYAKRDAIDYLRAQAVLQTDYQEADVHENLNQRSLNLQRLRDDVETLLKVLLGQIGGTRGVAVGRLVTTAPVMPTDEIEAPFDPNHSQYRGTPVRRYWRRPF